MIAVFICAYLLALCAVCLNDRAWILLVVEDLGQMPMKIFFLMIVGESPGKNSESAQTAPKSVSCYSGSEGKQPAFLMPLALW